MRKYRAAPTDLSGNAQPLCTYTVKDAGTETLTTLYDEDEVSELPNPGTANSLGEIIFRVPEGTVVDMTVTKASSSFSRTFTGITIGGGGGGREYHARFDFGAKGDDAHHALSSDEADAYNAKYGAYGLVVEAGDYNDWAALQGMLLVAASTGRACYIPTGIYHTNKPLTLSWTATPISGAPSAPAVTKIYGDGYSSQIKGALTDAGRAVLELLGESNGNAVNCEVSHLRLSMNGGNAGAYALRVGDSWAGIYCHRVACEGANGLAFKVASSISYADLNAHFSQCRFMSNYGAAWYPDETLATVFSVFAETGGSYWDNALFESCLFEGLVVPRAFVLNFHNCQFYTNATRLPDFAYDYSQNVFVTLGTANFLSCYFEDHTVAISAVPFTADVRGISIRDCQFTGVTNLGGTASRAISIYAGPNGQIGTCVIENNKIGSEYYADECIDLYGVHGRVSHNINLLHIGTPIRIRERYCNLQVDNTEFNEFGSLICNHTSTDFYNRLERLQLNSTDADGLRSNGGADFDGQVYSIDFIVKRIGNGDTPGILQGFSFDNAAGTDRVVLGWSSTTYTTGGAVPWIPDDSPFLYIPTGSTFRIGFGTAVTAHEITEGMIHSNGGVSASKTDYTNVGNVPQTLRFTVNHTQLAIAATSNVITLFQLQPGQYILASFIKHGQAFTGGSLSAYTLALGNNSITDKYADAFDVFQAPGNGKIGANGKVGMEDGLSGAAQNVQLTAVSTGSTLDAATGGTAEIWIVIGKLPA